MELLSTLQRQKKKKKDTLVFFLRCRGSVSGYLYSVYSRIHLDGLDGRGENKIWMEEQGPLKPMTESTILCSFLCFGENQVGIIPTFYI